MTSIPTSVARLKAIDRLIEVLQARYADAIVEVRDLMEQSPGQLADLMVDAPEADAYLYHPDNPDDDDAEPINHPVAVYISPDSPRELDRAGSVGPDGKREWRTFQVACVIMVRKDISEPIMRNGVELSDNGILKLRAEVYTGALIDCLLTYGCDHGASISDIDLIDDNADLYFIGETLIGVGGAVFQITQKTLSPARKQL